MIGFDDTTSLSDRSLKRAGLSGWLWDKYAMWRFQFTLLGASSLLIPAVALIDNASTVIDIGFKAVQLRQKILGGQEGFEDLLTKQVAEFAHNELGVDIDEHSFEG